MADHPGGRPDDDAARRPRGARRRAADRRARLRRRRRGARRAALADPRSARCCRTSLAPLLVEANLRLTYSIGLIAALAFLGFSPNPNGADWGFDDPGEPARARRRSRGASSCRSSRSRCSRSARAWSATASPGRPSASTGRGAASERPAGPPSSSPACASSLRGTGDRHRRRRRRSRSRRARCSAWSASRARARRPSGWRCSATPAAAPRSPAGRCCVGDATCCTLSSAASAAGCAAASSRTCPRIRPPRSTRRCGSARSCCEVLEAHSFGSGQSERARADRRDDARGGAARRPDVPAPVPARALGRPAAAHRPGDGVRVPSAGDRARRADHRPRRDDPGARARHGARAGGAARRRGALRQPRSGRGRQRWPTRVAVMYAGPDRRARADGGALRECAAHPYTRRLVAAIPHLSGRRGAGRHPGPGARRPGPADAAASSPRAARSCSTRAARRCHGCARSAPRHSVALHACRGGARPAPRRLGAADDARRRRTPASAVLALRDVHAGYGDLTVVHDVNLELAPQRVPGARGRVGVGQDDAGALDRRPAPRARRARSCARQPLARAARGRAARGRGRRSSTSSRTRTARSTRAGRSARSCASRSASSGRAGGRGRQAGRRDARARVADGGYADRYPDQLSGGERQRVAIARALVVRAVGARLRRGHVGARRERAGRDRRAARRAAARPRPGDAVRHPQPPARALDRPARGGDEPGPDRRAGRGRARAERPTDEYTQALLADTPSLETATA